MKRLLLASAITLAAVAAPASLLAQDAAPAPKETAGALFGTRENIEHADISPSGQYVVYLTPGHGRVTSVFVASLDGSAPPRLVMTSGADPDRLRWCNFATDTRLVCQITGLVDSAGILIPYSRLVAIDTDGKNGGMLGQRDSQFDARLRQFNGEVLDWLPDEPGAVLMSREYIPEAGKMNTRMVRNENGLGVDRIDLATLEASRVEGPAKDADFYITDGRGKVRIKGYRPGVGATSQLANKMVYRYRPEGSDEWQPFSTVEDGGMGLSPVAVDASCGCAYALQPLDGRLALYRVKLDGSMATELVYANDRVDVDGVLRIGRGDKVIGLTYAEEKRHAIYFDKEYGNLSRALGKALPNLPAVDFLGSSADNSKLLIHAGSDSDPGRYFVFDKTARALNEILVARPSLEGVALASVKPVSYPARDGTAIPGYLTLPPGKADARGLPAVLLPHGGPSARDEWGFDWLAQYLANQGYAVLQPNYRGSAGYGDAWLQRNGFQGWRTSIGDVTDGARWLVAQGIADADRLAIVGWSYGGYAALQAGVTEPGMFKALVAIAPVTDLEMLKSDARNYVGRNLVVDMVGSGKHTVEGSPLQNVARIQAPVLMFHGDMDLNVAVGHSREMDKQLRAAGKPSELVVYEGLEHSLVDSVARAAMLDRIGAFLQANTAE
ncbi:MAG TPA: S9 family peptidase [Arenimonas sp.]|uniref:alpha/beta hydrolase family protein n=1 Tax=Arenimonas sp. TaxID=1872635 RepID=UPI002D809E25|nr:S9 family peptidase [Arenimonas sp.]HEU0152489.1 S9 family peptidase [Arenimonas sp.]